MVLSEEKLHTPTVCSLDTMTNAMESATGVLFVLSVMALVAMAWANDIGRLLKAIQRTRERRKTEEILQRSKGLVSANIMMEKTGMNFGAHASAAWAKLAGPYLDIWESEKDKLNAAALARTDIEMTVM